MTVAEAPTKPQETAPLALSEEPTRRFRLRSTFIVAMALFVGMNALLSFLFLSPFDPYRFNYRGWSWWTFNALRHQARVSNVVLLGSSTMVSALAGSDANYLGKTLDLTSHHRSQYLEDALKKRIAGDIETFSLAAPGQMPSDAYITLKAMVASATRPDVVIYGVAPRDFIDSTLSAPGDTDAFKYLTRIVNIDDVASRLFRSPFAKLEWFIQRSVYLYGYSLDIRLILNDLTSSAIDFLLPRPWVRYPFTWWDRQRMIPNYLPAEIHPEAIMSGPVDRDTANGRYTDNTVEYLQRYKNPDVHTYKTQMFFLSQIAQFCHKERIELIIVNMPITLENIRLLKPGGYVGYLQGLNEFALRHDVKFFNLNDFSKYHKNDYHDSVHLNAFGGTKFFDDVCGVLINDERLHAIVAMSAEHLAKHREIATKRNSTTY